MILELEPGAAEQPDSRGKNFLHTAIIKVGLSTLNLGDFGEETSDNFHHLQSDLESLLFLISINVNVHSKTTDSNKLAPILLAVQVLLYLISINKRQCLHIQVGNEMMVRNLLLAGASTQERTLTGQTGDKKISMMLAQRIFQDIVVPII